MATELEVKVTDYVPEFVKLLQNAKGNLILTNTIDTLSSIAQAYQKVWIGFARGSMRVPGAKLIRSRGSYTRSIQIDDSKPYSKTVFTDFPPHKYIEEGHPEIDLKPGLLRGKSARQGKEGAYNIVAFRHFVPTAKETGTQQTTRSGVMPISIYRLMLQKSKEADQAKKQGTGPGGSSRQLTAGSKPENRSYQWGARLDSKLQRGRRSQRRSGYTWTAGKYAGMVRMEESTTKAKRSGYITFRVVSHASVNNSWIVPPQKPIPIRQATVDFVAKALNVEDILRQAIERDIS